MLKRCLFLFLFFQSFFCFWYEHSLTAQTGTPAMRHYSPDEYHGFAQNWCITQDKRGVMYFGNGKGILEYNGKTWRRFPTAQHSTVLSIAADKSGRVFVGGEAEVGYLAADSLGESYFVSLNSKIPEAEKKFSYVWSTYLTNDGICFVTSEKIICWNGKTMSFYHPKETFFTSFCARGVLYVMSNGEGLVKMENGKTSLLPNTQELDRYGVRAVLPYGEKDILVVTRNSGCFIYANGQLSKLPADGEIYWKEKGLYKGIQLPDGNYALATTGGGVLIMDPKGKTVELINEEKGIRGSSIYGLFIDRENELWLAQESGVNTYPLFSSSSLC